MPPIRAKGRVEQDEPCQPPRLELDVEQHDDAEEPHRPEDKDPTQRLLSGGELAEELGMVPQGERQRPDGLLDLPRDPPEITTMDIAGDIQSPRAAFALDLVRRRLDRDLRDVAERHLCAERTVDEKVADSPRIVPQGRGAPHGDRICALPFVDFADRGALQHGAGGAPHVTHSEPEALRRVGAHADRDMGDHHARLDLEIGYARNARHEIGDFLRFGAQLLHVRAEDADHDGSTRPGQDLLDALVQIGEHVAVESG